jgi:hypothetical protein
MGGRWRGGVFVANESRGMGTVMVGAVFALPRFESLQSRSGDGERLSVQRIWVPSGG